MNIRSAPPWHERRPESPMTVTNGLTQLAAHSPSALRSRRTLDLAPSWTSAISRQVSGSACESR
eukprot:750038-Hanusia_phi.AAC.3